MNLDVLEVINLRMSFPGKKGLTRRNAEGIRAVNDVSFSLHRGETLGLCGESGCGKTTLARCITRLYQPAAGKIIFEGVDISTVPERRLRKARSRMSLVFQDPYSSLNPRQRIRNTIGEPLRAHHTIGRRDYADRVRQLCEMVGLDWSIGDRYPHELSGGQRQRVGIARALACSPSLVICDEPVSSLDASMQAQIIHLLQALRLKHGGLAYLFISHDLSVIRHMSDRIAVMYLGRIVEMASTSEFYSNPLHPYTKLLLSSAQLGADSGNENSCEYLDDDDGFSVDGPNGCSFRPRCFMAAPECRDSVPELRDLGSGHQVACLRV